MMTYFEFYRVIDGIILDGRYDGRSMGGVREVFKQHLPSRNAFKQRGCGRKGEVLRCFCENGKHAVGIQSAGFQFVVAKVWTINIILVNAKKILQRLSYSGRP